MTREEVLNTMGQILFALEDSKCPEARMAEQIIEWIEGLPIAVPGRMSEWERLQAKALAHGPTGDLHQTTKPKVRWARRRMSHERNDGIGAAIAGEK